MNDGRCCGTCQHCDYDNSEMSLVCVNDESEYLADWVEHDHSCDCWEGK